MYKRFLNKYIFPAQLDWTLIFLWGPIFIQTIMVFVLTVANNILMGRQGVENLAALGIGGNYINTIMGIFFFLTFISTTVVAYYKGAGEKIKNTMVQLDCMFFAGIVGILSTIVFEILTPLFIGLFPLDKNVEQLTTLYAQIFLLSIPFIFFAWTCIGILKGLQKVELMVKISSIFLAFELVINIFFVGVCHLGIIGVAIGPIITNFLQSVTFVYFICRDFDRTAMKKYEPHILRLFNLIKDSIPLMIRSSTFWIIILVSLWCFSTLGTDYVAAGQLGDVVLSFSMYVFDALAAASQALVGEARGAKDNKKIIQITRSTRRLAHRFIPVVIIFYFIGGYFLIKAMTDDQHVSNLSFLLVLLSLIALPITSYTYSFDGFFLGFAKYHFLLKAAVISTLITAGLMFLFLNLIQDKFWLFAIIYLVYEVIFVGLRGLYNKIEFKKIVKTLN
ncbi:MAG: hypothetical protein LBT99_00510 [Bifidobacteriaceae bacterium]|jgi:putative MATE family efflux protein|nr:hypothetical protein [Bifidobacteriaceae bacterium]